MQQPLISIIIPCYNSRRFVAEAIQSARQQTYPNTEIIVVDDGSTDSSLEVIRSFGDSIRCLTGPNIGAAAARNKGVQASQGKLIQFLDADDLLYPQKLERQLPLALQHRPGMVFCDADVIDLESGESRGTWALGSVSTSDPVVHALRLCVQTSGPLHWKETFNLVGGFRPQTPPCDDRDLHLRMACANIEFVYLAERNYVMRRVSGSLSKRDPTHGLAKLQMVGEDALRQLQEAGEMIDRRRVAFAAFFMTTARMAWQHRQNQLANECLRRAYELHPDGGAHLVYSFTGRLMARMVGLHATDQIISWKRWLCRNRGIA